MAWRPVTPGECVAGGPLSTTAASTFTRMPAYPAHQHALPAPPSAATQVDCDGAGNLEVCFSQAGSAAYGVQQARVYASCRAPTTCSVQRLENYKTWAPKAGASTTVSVCAEEGGWNRQCRCPDGSTPYLIVEAGVGHP